MKGIEPYALESENKIENIKICFEKICELNNLKVHDIHLPEEKIKFMTSSLVKKMNPKNNFIKEISTYVIMEKLGLGNKYSFSKTSLKELPTQEKRYSFIENLKEAKEITNNLEKIITKVLPFDKNEVKTISEIKTAEKKTLKHNKSQNFTDFDLIKLLERTEAISKELNGQYSPQEIKKIILLNELENNKDIAEQIKELNHIYLEPEAINDLEINGI